MHPDLKPPSAKGSDEEASQLSGDKLAAKIALIDHEARRQFLAEMTDPTVRIWLIFLVIYGTQSAKLFLDYTQSDDAGVAFKAPCIVRSRIAYLERLADEELDPLQHPDFTPLLDFVEARPTTYDDLNSVRATVRKAASTAAYYFQGENGAQSTPRQQRALRWLRHPALLVLGLLDE